MTAEFDGWKRTKVVHEGREIEVYQTEVWGKTINVDTCLLDLCPWDERADFLRLEKAKAMVAFRAQ